jgi:hypothetical protein
MTYTSHHAGKPVNFDNHLGKCKARMADRETSQTSPKMADVAHRTLATSNSDPQTPSHIPPLVVPTATQEVVKSKNPWRHFVAGGLAGVIGASITCPLEVPPSPIPLPTRIPPPVHPAACANPGPVQG